MFFCNDKNKIIKQIYNLMNFIFNWVQDSANINNDKNISFNLGKYAFMCCLKINIQMLIKNTYRILIFKIYILFRFHQWSFSLFLVKRSGNTNSESEVILTKRQQGNFLYGNGSYFYSDGAEEHKTIVPRVIN